MKYKILVIDDEENIVKLLKDYFEIEDFIVYTAFNGVEALEKLEYKPDIILLDIGMPEMDGLELCKRIRNYVTCPILFLTAKVQEQDRINGLVVGGDDYILKPFSIDELGARVNAHLRREERKNSNNEIRFFKDITITYLQREVYYKEEKILLTKTEFDIVEILTLNKNQIFTKEKLYETLWGYDKEGDSGIITEHIRRIRSKISKYTNEAFIETIWGVGYKWIG